MQKQSESYRQLYPVTTAAEAKVPSNFQVMRPARDGNKQSREENPPNSDCTLAVAKPVHLFFLWCSRVTIGRGAQHATRSAAIAARKVIMRKSADPQSLRLPQRR